MFLLTSPIRWYPAFWRATRHRAGAEQAFRADRHYLSHDTNDPRKEQLSNTPKTTSLLFGTNEMMNSLPISRASAMCASFGEATIQFKKSEGFPSRPAPTISLSPTVTRSASSRPKPLGQGDLIKIAQDFYNDAYLFDQNACSSPHLIVWIGTKETIHTASRDSGPPSMTLWKLATPSRLSLRWTN